MISRGGKDRPGRICQVGVMVPRVLPIYLHVCSANLMKIV